MNRLPHSVIVMALVTALAGCKTDSQLRTEQARAYVTSHGQLDPRTAAAIVSNQVHKDMTKEQVIASWGQPVYVQRFGKGVEYWYFDCVWPHTCDGSSIGMLPEEQYRTRATFHGGRVTEWEN